MRRLSAPAKSQNCINFLHGFQPNLQSGHFSSVPTREEITHLILQQKSASEALQTFRWASEVPKFRHDQTTYRALIQKLCAFRQFEQVDKLLEEMRLSISSAPDEAIFLTIIKGFGRARMVKKAIGVLDSFRRFGNEPSLKLFNSVLDILVKEDIDLARDFYREKMRGGGVKGDDYTFGILMKGLCSTNRIGEGFKLLSLMTSVGLKPNTVIYNTLLHALCRHSKVGRARSLMSEMSEPNDVTFNIMISGYCKEGNIVLALVMLKKCFGQGFAPDVIAITKLVDALCGEGRIMEAVDVLERVEKKKGDVLDVVAYNSLIKGFCRSGKAKVGLRFLKEMERKGCLPNLNTYNVLITGLCESEDSDSAFDLFQEMGMVGIDPDFITYDTLIKGLCSEGRVAEGLKILGKMEEQNGGLVHQISPYNSIMYGFYKVSNWEEALIFLNELEKYFPRVVGRSLGVLGLSKEGKFAEAMEVYSQMVSQGDSPCALVYASLIDGLCKNGEVHEAFKLMNEMVMKAYFPTDPTFNSIVSGFCKVGEVGRAAAVVEEMSRRGCIPDGDSCSPLIDVLCGRGHFQKASLLLEQFVGKGIAPTSAMWDSLLPRLAETGNWGCKVDIMSMISDHL